MKTLKYFLNKIEYKYSMINEELKKSNYTGLDGSLITSKKGNFVEYYHSKYENGNQIRTYIPKKNIKLAENLSQKKYRMKLKRILDKNLKLIIKLNKSYKEHEIDEVYNSLNKEEQKLVSPYEPTWNQVVDAWYKMESITNPYAKSKIPFIQKEVKKSDRKVKD